jgi:Hemerythrin HHE cation binding domain
LRRDFGRLRDTLASPAVAGAVGEALHGHWRFVSGQLEHHHRTEDEVLWPLVRAKLSGDAEALAVLERMEAQHRTLAPARDTVDGAFEAYRGHPGATEDLVAALDELRACVTEHLDDEEAHTFPLVDRALNDEEFGSFEKATAKGLGLRGAARFFPWVVEGADPGDVSVALGALPPPLRALCRRRWIPRYERQLAAVWPG